MANEFMRIGGRDSEGKAQPISTDRRGNARVKKHKNIELETVINDIIQGGYNESFWVETDDADEIYIVVSIDKPLWQIRTADTPFNAAQSFQTGVYPHMPPRTSEFNQGYLDDVATPEEPLKYLACISPGRHPQAVYNDVTNRFEWSDFDTARNNVNNYEDLAFRFARPTNAEDAQVKLSVLKIWR